MPFLPTKATKATEAHSSEAPSGDNLVQVRNVTLGYTTDRTRYVAVQDVSLDIDAGEMVMLLGPSGCGKSTLLKAIAGFISPLSGTIRIAGKTNPSPGPDRAVVFQEFDQLFPWRTVRGNISYPLRVVGLPRERADEIADEFLHLTGLTRVAANHPHQLSGGMKQRVAIARALSLGSLLVLMDEPFGSLDAMTRLRLQDELRELVHETNKTILFVTHSIEEAIRLGDRIVIMSDAPARIASILSTNSYLGREDELRDELHSAFDIGPDRHSQD